VSLFPVIIIAGVVDTGDKFIAGCHGIDEIQDKA
jgi:hypothetical protein